MREEWKPIKDYELLYLISNYGKVYILNKKRLIKPCKDKDGYIKINLYKDGKVKHTYLHRLVAETFIPNPNKLPLVLHKIPISNGGTNDVNNLYWR